MTHLIRENAVERFETSNVDMIEELHVMLAAQDDAPAAQPAPQPSAPKSLFGRWFSPHTQQHITA